MELNVIKPTRKYEAVLILHPDASEKDQQTFFKKQKETIKKYSGELYRVETWGKRRLANPIKKLKMGTYFHTMFEANSDCVAELERTMRINDQVLRFMHTRLDDRKTIAQHFEDYKNLMKESIEREQERERAFQRKQAKRR